MLTVTDALSILIWLQGIILCIAGSFYLSVSLFNFPRVTAAEGKRVVILLGMCCWGIGISEVATGWAHGLIRYLEDGGAVWVGEFVLVVRVVTVVLMIVALLDVVLTWQRASNRDGAAR
jgi:hypothetical protein